jgi:hypothetical protein
MKNYLQMREKGRERKKKKKKIYEQTLIQRSHFLARKLLEYI